MNRLVAIVAFCVAFGVLGTANAADPEAYATDARGQSYRVAFDRHNRLRLDVGYGAGAADGLELGTDLGFAFSADFPEEEIWWRLRHTVLDLSAYQVTNGWQARVGLLAGDYLRHDVSSWILIPGDADLRLPGPFDIVVRWQVAAATFDDNGFDVALWEVFELDFLLDFIRDPFYRHRLAVGATMDYEIVDRNHEITPLSAATILYGWEHPDGLVAAQVEGRFERLVTLRSGIDPTWDNRLSGRAELEWTPIALNDEAIALYAAAEGRTLDETEWRVAGGLRITYQGDD